MGLASAAYWSDDGAARGQVINARESRHQILNSMGDDGVGWSQGSIAPSTLLAVKMAAGVLAEFGGSVHLVLDAGDIISPAKFGKTGAMEKLGRWKEVWR